MWTWIGLCLVVGLLHPFVRRARWRRRLRGPRPRRALPRTRQIASCRRRHLPNFSFPRLSLWEVVRIRRPFPRRRRTIPSAPLLLLEVLVLPSIPAACTVLPALALVHGERINVVHHASITVRALHTHSQSQHHRPLIRAARTRHIKGNNRDWLTDEQIRAGVSACSGRGDDGERRHSCAPMATVEPPRVPSSSPSWLTPRPPPAAPDPARYHFNLPNYIKIINIALMNLDSNGVFIFALKTLRVIVCYNNINSIYLDRFFIINF